MEDIERLDKRHTPVSLHTHASHIQVCGLLVCAFSSGNPTIGKHGVTMKNVIMSLWSEKADVERKTTMPIVTLFSCENGAESLNSRVLLELMFGGTCEDFFWLPRYLWSLTLPFHRQWAPGLNELVRGPHPPHYFVFSSLCHLSDFSFSQTSSEERILVPNQKKHNSLSKKAAFVGLRFHPNLKTALSTLKKNDRKTSNASITCKSLRDVWSATS